MTLFLSSFDSMSTSAETIYRKFCLFVWYCFEKYLFVLRQIIDYIVVCFVWFYGGQNLPFRDGGLWGLFIR